MSIHHNKGVDALRALLLELPAEFGMNPADFTSSRTQFKVIKARNVRKVHEALWELQEYFGLTEE